MTIATYERGKWETLSIKLEEAIKNNKVKPKEERKTLNQVFEDFADENNTSAGSARNYYYSDVKPRIDKKIINVDDNIDDFTHSVRPEKQLQDTRFLAKIGEIFDATVTSIQHFGVFAVSDNGVEGLIHISEITGKEYVDFPEDFFYVGEKIKVKVCAITKEGKIAFSTRKIGGKERINPVFKELSTKANEKLVFSSPPAKQPQTPTQDKPEIKHEQEPIQSNDKDSIINFIKKYSDNNVSHKALLDIDEMISKFGVFQTTLSLVETVRDLDVSSFITDMTKDRLNGEYLRRNA